MENFKRRWNIKSNLQLIIILIVFAITGSTSAYVAKPILSYLSITKESVGIWLYIPLYIIIILPVYKIILIAIGTLFGQKKFFSSFIINMLKKMKLNFIAKLFE